MNHLVIHGISLLGSMFCCSLQSMFDTIWAPKMKKPETVLGEGIHTIPKLFLFWDMSHLFIWNPMKWLIMNRMRFMMAPHLFIALFVENNVTAMFKSLNHIYLYTYMYILYYMYILIHIDSIYGEY